MKKASLNYEFDSSNKSVSILRDLVSKYLKEEFKIENAWFCDYHLPHRITDYDKVIDIVFFGDFFKKFLIGSLWPFEKYRFWVLSNSVKNVLVKLLNVPESSIFVIPRDKLVKQTVSEQVFTLNEIQRFYYAGQLRIEKNISLLIWTTYYLQKNYNKNIQLNLIGDFYLGDNIQEPYLTRIKYKDYILDLIKILDWTIPPVLHGKVIDFNWKNYPNKSCYINLSTFIYEDFGLAQSEATAAEMPSIISSWGGFNDHLGGSSIKIPANILGNENNSTLVSQVRGNAIANYLNLSSVEFTTDHFSNETGVSLSLPAEISIEQLQLIRKEFVKQTGPAIYEVFTNAALVLDSHKTSIFFQNYYDIFSNRVFNPKKIFLIDDTLSLTPEFLNRVLLLDYDKHTEIILLKNLRYKPVLSKFFAAEIVLIPNELKENQKLLEVFNISKDQIKYF